MPQVPRDLIRGYERYTGLALASRPNILIKLERQLQSKVVTDRVARNRLRIANEKAVQWLVQHSSQELHERIEANGRRQEDPRNLERVVASAQLTSTWNDQGFQWFRSSKVNRTNVRRYWRVIEQGSNYWVRRSRETGEGLIFTGTSAGFGAAAGSRFRSTGFDRSAGTSEVRVVGPWPDGRFRGAPIKRPIPAYHYLDATNRAFEGSGDGTPGVYERIVKDAFKGTAIRWRHP